MSDHPSREELTALCLGELPRKRRRIVVLHLLGACQRCLAQAEPPLSTLLGLEPARREPSAAEDAAYDAAIGRALEKARRHERRHQNQEVQERRILRRLEKKGITALEELPRSIGPLPRMNAFLAWSWRLRHQDPEQMVQFAWLAVQVSLQLDVARYGLARVQDLQARAHAELGNAYRVMDRYLEAAEKLSRARELFERGTRDPFLETRLLELEASLYADRRQFGRAADNLLKVFDFYSQRDELHLAGRTLVLMGLYAGYAGEHDKAIRRLEEGLALVDAERDPGLACAAAHNLILFLVESGRFQEAKKLRFVHSRHLVDPGGRVNEIKFRALEGSIDAGMGRYRRAENIFREVRADYVQIGRHSHAGIATLDLAAVLLAQGKAKEAAAVALEAAETFRALGIQREGLEAVILLRNAFETETATLEKVEEVAKFLRRLEVDPVLRFEGRAWERPGR